MTRGVCSSHPLLAELSGEEQKAAALCLKEFSLKAGESLWCEGQEADYVLFIVEGEVELLKETEFAGSRFVIGLLGAGSAIGEEALTSKDAKRPESALAGTDSRFLRLDRGEMEKLSAENPGLALSITTRLLGLSVLRLSHAYKRMAAIF
jgi:CRP-like cAMP-binding protein